MTGQQTYLDNYFEEAEHDALTDLLNLGSFEKLLNIYEKGDAPYALIIVDVDYFKSVNDTCGHSAQDDGLPRVSLSVGVAFSDRPDPTGTIFQDADQALYHQKNHGKAGCSFYQK